MQASSLGSAATHPVAALAHKLNSGGPPKGLSSLPLPCFARKPRVRLPWRTRSAGRRFTGPSSFSASPLSLWRMRNPFRARSGPLFACLGAWLGERRLKKTLRQKHRSKSLSPRGSGKAGEGGPGLRLPSSLRLSKGVLEKALHASPITDHGSRFTVHVVSGFSAAINSAIFLRSLAHDIHAQKAKELFAPTRVNNYGRSDDRLARSSSLSG